MSKFVLDTKTLSEDFFEDARLLGIMAPLDDYKFCHLLNLNLGTDFRINNELEIQLIKKNRDYFFSIYEYCAPSISLEYYIYNNHYDGEYLLPELKHLDYLWLLKGDVVSNDSFHLLAENVRTIDAVQLVVELTNEKIKHKSHLVF